MSLHLDILEQKNRKRKAYTTAKEIEEWEKVDKIMEEMVESNIFKNPRQEREGAFVTDFNFNLENIKT